MSEEHKVKPNNNDPQYNHENNSEEKAMKIHMVNHLIYR